MFFLRAVWCGDLDPDTLSRFGNALFRCGSVGFENREVGRENTTYATPIGTVKRNPSGTLRSWVTAIREIISRFLFGFIIIIIIILTRYVYYSCG